MAVDLLDAVMGFITEYLFSCISFGSLTIYKPVLEDTHHVKGQHGFTWCIFAHAHVLSSATNGCHPSGRLLPAGRAPRFSLYAVFVPPPLWDYPQ